MKTNSTAHNYFALFQLAGLCVFLSIAVSCSNKSREETKIVKLTSDGPDKGLGAYQLIIDKFGSRSIETPDLFADGHTDVKHIYEDKDPIVGNHFVFTMHLLEDGNCDKCGDDIVQRNEIKIHKKSSDALKGFKGEAFRYSWKFKIDKGFQVSEHFTNFFQLKPYNPDFLSPIIKLTARKRGTKNVIEVRYKSDPINGNFETLGKVRLKKNLGEWFEMSCEVTYAEANQGGQFYFDMTSLETDQNIFSIKKDNINMWSGGKTEFMRPKWGIVRSIENTDRLRSEEERVRIADIEINKLQ